MIINAQSGGMFSSFINISYNTGNCVCKLGDELFSHSGGGTASFEVKKKGTWVITVSNCLETKSTSVAVSKSGETYSVSLSISDGTLYSSGNQYSSITGGWKARAIGYPHSWGGYYEAPSLSMSGNMKITLVSNGHVFVGSVTTANPVDVTDFKSIKFKIASNAQANKHNQVFLCKSIAEQYSAAASANFTSAGDINLDVSKLSGKYYVGVCVYTSGSGTTTCNVSNIKLNL